jgi:uncharacterized membrane protein
MTELLFGLTVVFVGYVLFEVFKTVSQTYNAAPPPSKPLYEPPPEAPKAPAEPVPASAELAATPESIVPDAERGSQLRNPATGEISAVPTNYRFAKKWIKEALVAEGLLERVYKPSELDEAATRKVKEALDKFRWLEKYQP